MFFCNILLHDTIFQTFRTSDINKNNINEDDEDTYTALDETMVGKDESNYEALTLPEGRKVSFVKCIHHFSNGCK